MNCLIKHVLEIKVEVTGRRGKRRKEVLDDLQEKRCRRDFKEDTLDFTVCELAMKQDMDKSPRVLRG
jgi:hypothetical protein